ncbi:MAG: ABC transporter ATP-binding protein [Planctomycetes bacterium]|nr:ABC transporter ATP-binding protein [Planctomycetota bacterium]
MNEAGLIATGLCFRYGKQTLLDGLTLEVPRGAVTVLLGENGAGKTTLMRLALGLLKPRAGTLRVLGLDPLRKPRAVRERVGFVPAEPDAPQWMSFDALCRFLRPQFPRWDDARADELAVRLRIPRTRPFRTLSRGEGMKAMLVAALAPQPELLLLDEPFAGLDPLARDEVLGGVIGALRDEGRAVLCTTHDLDAAARVADRVALLAQGHIVRAGALADFAGSGSAGSTEALRAAVVATIREVQPCG